MLPSDLAQQYHLHLCLSPRQTSHIATPVGGFMRRQPELFHLLPWYGEKSRRLFNLLLHLWLDCQQLPRRCRKNWSFVSHPTYHRERRLHYSCTDPGRRGRPGLRKWALLRDEAMALAVPHLCYVLRWYQSLGIAPSDLLAAGSVSLLILPCMQWWWNNF